MCAAQSSTAVCCVSEWPFDIVMIFFTLTHCNIIQSRPRATWEAAAPDLTQRNLLVQSVFRHAESMTYPPEYFALQLRRKF